MSMDQLQSYDLHVDHKMRYFYPETDPGNLLGRVQKYLDLNPDIFITDIAIKGYFSEDDEAQVWEATVTAGSPCDAGAR